MVSLLPNPRRAHRPGRKACDHATELAPTLSQDPNFFDAQVPVATGKNRDGQVVLAAKNTPLIVEANRGRGQVTLLTFSPSGSLFGPGNIVRNSGPSS